ncbi:MAG: hypothetical protein IV100_00655 [Myxococcales bacterium]|nr:hypothetical protein [Myxococcales bacterium]
MNASLFSLLFFTHLVSTEPPAVDTTPTSPPPVEDEAAPPASADPRPRARPGEYPRPPEGFEDDPPEAEEKPVTPADPVWRREWRLDVGAGAFEGLGDGFVMAAASSTAFTPRFAFSAELVSGLLLGAEVRGVTPLGKNNLLGMDASIGVLDFGPFVRWHTPVLPWVRPFVIGSVGASRATFTIAGADIDEVAWAVAVLAEGGVELRTLPNALIGTLALSVEVAIGYSWRSDFDFVHEPGGAASLPLGVVSVHGPSYRLGVGVIW